MNGRECYQAGKLKEAIAAMTEEVKQHPADTSRRGFLCELLCFTGELEKADRQLDVMGTQDPTAMVGISLFRQLIRAEQARQQFYSEGRLPEFLDQPSPELRLRLEASIQLREGQVKEAARLLEQAEEQRAKPSGTCGGQPFTDFRDLDDLTASFFEVLTSNGVYYWVPMDRVEQLEFRPPTRPRDLLWQRVHMVVSGGPDGEVYLPTLYANTPQDADDRVRLGRATEWRGGEGEPTRGIGQRTFLVGEEGLPILELKEIIVNSAAG
ncbi:MAG: SciE type virulence protein [Planctomycetes bacterium]|nr:SciE type virulence protein [Planctomycetota bacterium]